MDVDDMAAPGGGEVRPVIGLTRGLPIDDVELLTVKAIRLHRHLLEKADRLFQALPQEYKSETVAGGAQHLEYIEAMIEMHCQMGALNTLVGLLGYIPKVSVN